MKLFKLSMVIVSVLSVVQVIPMDLVHTHIRLPAARSQVVLSAQERFSIFCGICLKEGDDDEVVRHWPHKRGNIVHDNCYKIITDIEKPILALIFKNIRNNDDQERLFRLWATSLDEMCDGKSISEFYTEKGLAYFKTSAMLGAVNNLIQHCLLESMHDLKNKIGNLKMQRNCYLLSTDVRYQKLTREINYLTTQQENVAQLRDDLQELHKAEVSRVAEIVAKAKTQESDSDTSS